MLQAKADNDELPTLATQAGVEAEELGRTNEDEGGANELDEGPDLIKNLIDVHGVPLVAGAVSFVGF